MTGEREEWIGFLEMVGMISLKCVAFGGSYISYCLTIGEDVPDMAMLSRGAYVIIALLMGKEFKSSYIWCSRTVVMVKNYGCFHIYAFHKS